MKTTTYSGYVSVGTFIYERKWVEVILDQEDGIAVLRLLPVEAERLAKTLLDKVRQIEEESR